MFSSVGFHTSNLYLISKGAVLLLEWYILETFSCETHWVHMPLKDFTVVHSVISDYSKRWPTERHMLNILYCLYQFLWSAPCGLFPLFQAVLFLASAMCSGWNKGSVSDNGIVNFWFSRSCGPSGISANSYIGMEDFHCHNNLDLVLSCASSSKTVSAAALQPEWENGGNKGGNKGIKIEHVSNYESQLMSHCTTLTLFYSPRESCVCRSEPIRKTLHFSNHY